MYTSKMPASFVFAKKAVLAALGVLALSQPGCGVSALYADEAGLYDWSLNNLGKLQDYNFPVNNGMNLLVGSE